VDISGILTYVLFTFGLGLIAFGADWFVDAAVNISKRSGIPKAVIGATIVSFATTAPEFFVSFMAAIGGHPDLAIGNAVGSTICNIGIAIGFIVVLRAVSIDDKSFNIKALMMLAAGAILFILSYSGMITKLYGAILLLVFIAYITFTYIDQKRQEETGKNNKSEPIVRKGIWSKIKMRDSRLDILMFLAGAVFVIGGSRLVVDNGILIAGQIGIPEIIIGLTVVSIGTSLPEIITAITSFRKGFQELSIGNIVGANILDITMILGVSAMFADLPINGQLLRYDYIFMMLMFVLVAFFGFRKKITRTQGAIISVVYIAYVIGLFVYVPNIA
jgi:K+-dependent Na+/Ca+ exchanger related-protein